MKWSIRDLLNPVATRSLLFGANPFDLEFILKKIDGIKVKSGKQIQSVWLGEWAQKIERYNTLAEQAEQKILPREKVATTSRNSGRNDKYKNAAPRENTKDAEALSLMKKFRTFGRRTPEFLLTKVELADDNQ